MIIPPRRLVMYIQDGDPQLHSETWLNLTAGTTAFDPHIVEGTLFIIPFGQVIDIDQVLWTS
jgi:hypothetical protein